MSFKMFNLRHDKCPTFPILPLLFLIFLLVGCKDAGTSGVTCTYTLTFDPNATQDQKDKAKAEFEASVQTSAGSSDTGITCSSTTSWDESDPKQLQATVTINCNKSDSGAIRPPAQTKPPASRLSYGTLVKVNCSDE